MHVRAHTHTQIYTLKPKLSKENLGKIIKLFDFKNLNFIQ